MKLGVLKGGAPRMLPGQVPYTPAELRRLARWIDEACASDPGEQGEVDGSVPDPCLGRGGGR